MSDKPKKTLYLHIGYPKTATSALQTFLWLNRSVLLKQGVLYPEKAGIVDVAHHEFAWCLQDRNTDRTKTFKDYWAEVHEESGADKAHTVILSTEDFCRRQPLRELKRIQEVTKGWDVKVIVYLRRQDAWAESAYRQVVRGQPTRVSHPISFWIQSPLTARLDYREVLNSWAQGFSAENILVRVFEKQQLPNGIFADFLETIGLKMNDGYRLPRKDVVNSSLSAEATEFLRQINTLPLTDTQHRKLTTALLHISPQTESEKVFFMSPKERRDLLELYDPANSEIARTYLNREDGKLFLAPWPEPDEPWEAPTLDPQAAGWLMTNLAHRLKKTRGIAKAAPESPADIPDTNEAWVRQLLGELAL